MTYPYEPHDKPGMFRSWAEAAVGVGLALLVVFVVVAVLWTVFR